MIHKTTIIEDGAQIADDVTIGPFCFIGKNVTISSGCTLESNIILKGKLLLKEGVKVFSFAAIGHESSEVSVGEKTHIREFTQIGTQESEGQSETKVTIGSNNFIMGYVQILSGVKLGEYCIITNAVRLYENVTCQDRVIVGGLSTIEANNTLGTGVMIGGASYIDQDMPPFTLVEGNKATIKSLNVIGLRRRLENKDDIEEIKSIFKRILGENIDKELALEISQTHENEYARQLAYFVANSNIQ